MNNKKISYIAISNDILENQAVSVRAKYLFLILKTFCFDKTETTNVNKKLLMEKLKWSDNRTLLNHLSNLKNKNYIDYDFKTLPTRDLLKIKLNISEPFTIIDLELFNRILEYKNREHSLIFVYLMEKYYNPNYGYAFPSVLTIQSIIKTSNSKLHNITMQLHEDRICEYCKGLYIKDECRQSNNKYLPNVKVNDNGVYKRRYSHHKKPSYFNITDEDYG